MSRPPLFPIVVLLGVATYAICAAAEPGDDSVPPTKGDSQAAPDDDSPPPAPTSQLPPDDAELPWTQKPDSASPPANVRELLPNVSEGDLAGLHDGEPIETDGQDVLYRLLERTQGITPLNFERFAEPEPIWQQLAEDQTRHVHESDERSALGRLKDRRGSTHDERPARGGDGDAWCAHGRSSSPSQPWISL